MTPHLLFYPAANVRKALTRVTAGKVLHPPAQNGVDLLDEPPERSRAMASEDGLEFAQERRACLGPGPALGPRFTGWGGIIEGRVETQPGNHTGTGPGLDFVQGSRAAKQLSATQASSRPGHHRTTSRIICHARSVKV